MVVRLLFSALLLITNVVLLSSSSVSAAGIAATILVLLPGAALGWRLFGRSDELSTGMSLCLASGFLWLLLFTFALDALPGAVSSADLLMLLDVLTVICILGIPARPLGKSSFPPHAWLLLIVLLIGLGTRFLHLGTAEFQGDETRALFLASGMAAGDDGILFLHRKGPAEALFASPPLLLLGRINEASARFPFALAGGLLILSVYALGRRLWNKAPAAALVAAALIACDGFLFAFSRIVQYQTILVYLLSASFLSASLLSSKRISSGLALHGASAFAAGALLCHYDTIFAVPALAFYVLTLLREQGKSWGDASRLLLPAAAQFIVLCAAFYAPFLLHESFSGTAGYLSQRLGFEKLPAHNLPRYLTLSSFYGGGFSVVLAFSAAAAGIIAWTNRSAAARAVCTSGLLLLALTSFFVGSPTGSKTLAALGALGLVLAVAPLLLSRSTALSPKVLFLWIGAGLLGLGFFFARPNTHFYVVHVPLALAAGAALSQCASFGRSAALAAGAVVAAVFVLSILYLQHVFLNPNIEYRFVFPKTRPWYALDFVGRKLPAGAFFGFQRRSGWKAAGVLYATGRLHGSYASNEEELITAWYMHPQIRNQADADVFFVATRPNDPVPISPSRIEAEYSFWGRIYVDERRSLDIFTKIRRDSAPQRFELEGFVRDFDRRDAVFADARAALLASPSR